jgi:UDP-N-acetylglucosamine 2-epimerase (non-hydrolysing)
MIYFIGGARPNFMKIAALTRAFDNFVGMDYEIIHTGQHYDYNMNQVFFEEFGLKEPKYHLEVGSGNHGKQTGRIMEELEKICIEKKPDMVVCVGDVNSTMAAALVASKLHIPVAHQEAGMRSGDKKMPEEINRICTDHVSDLLFPISPQDRRNLYNEGIYDNVYLVGDPMIDNLLYYTNKIPEREVNDKHFLVELHRPANVDDPKKLTEIMIGLSQLSEKFHVVFTIHPRTRKMIYKFGLTQYLDMIDHCEPMGYFDFHEMMKYAGCVITDSDGIQQETSILNVSCLAIRDTSNIQYTIDYGTTQLCEPDRDEIFNKAVTKFHTVEQNTFPPQLKELNDGKASERIAQVINSHIKNKI